MTNQYPKMVVTSVIAVQGGMPNLDLPLDALVTILRMHLSYYLSPVPLSNAWHLRATRSHVVFSCPNIAGHC